MDAVTHSYIVNKTSERIEIIVKLDQIKIEESVAEPNYEMILRQFASDSCIIIEMLDTLNLVGKYSMNPGCSFTADLGRGKEPNFDFNTLIIVKADDTIKFENEADIKDAFVLSKGFTYKLNIE
jgi:hypothetical protein